MFYMKMGKGNKFSPRYYVYDINSFDQYSYILFQTKQKIQTQPDLSTSQIICFQNVLFNDLTVLRAPDTDQEKFERGKIICRLVRQSQKCSEQGCTILLMSRVNFR